MDNMSYGKFITKLENVCTKYANKIAIVYLRKDGIKDFITFQEMFERICMAKECFVTVGLYPGDRVAIIAPHSPYTVIAGLALAYSNITSVLIDVSLPPEEINRLIKLSDIRAIYTVPTIYESLDKELVYHVPIFNINVNDICSIFKGSARKATQPSTERYLDVIAILYSSGTTASMKGIMLTYHTVLLAQEMYLVNTGLTADMTYLLVLPFHHVAGYSNSLQYFLTGCEIGMIEDVDSTKLGKGLSEYQPVFFAIVPKETLI